MSNVSPKVLFITSELTPFSKTGGLADVSAALPRALAHCGCQVRIVTPCYGSIHREKFGIAPAAELGRYSAKIAGRPIQSSFSRICDGGDAYDALFVECAPLYGRDGIYSDPVSGMDYIDNDYRYAYLCQSAMEYCRLIGWMPEIIHCNDWQTSLSAFYLNRLRANDTWTHCRSLLTIHNIAYQGNFSAEAVGRIDGAGDHYYPGGPFEFHSRVNFLKVGLEFADALNTVSPTYAREICSGPEYGFGMETVLAARPDGVVGILNGLDVDLWNPAADSRIPAVYTAETLERKALNKNALCARIGLPYEESTLLLGMISRITSQKGFEILLQALPSLLMMPCRFVLLGSGDPAYENPLREFARTRPDRFQLRIGYDDDLAHLIESGADAFLMPSRYEPCGLNQMMSMRYGSPPIVRATGGLADTVVDADQDPAAGNGFVFNEFTSNNLLHAIHRAVSAFSNKWRWQQIQKNGMACDFSWDRSAEHYMSLYKECLKKPPRLLSHAPL